MNTGLQDTIVGKGDEMATNPDLNGKVALVTGASRGIGADIARVLAREGMTVIGAARTENEGDFRVPGALATTISSITEAGGKAVARRVDLSRDEEIHELWEWAVGEFGQIHAVVNNAGILAPGTIENMNWRHFGLVFQINVAAPALLSRLAAPHMRANGGGAIINITSGASRGPGPGPYEHASRGGTPYGYSKAALERLTQGMAAELCEDNISVNCTMPAHQVWVGGTIYAQQQSNPDFDNIDLTGKRKDGTIMGDACAAILRADYAIYTGRVTNDEDTLRELTGATSFEKYPVY
jgi:NAD(P)-dependent dehydrogenase (short-subunit alcohol dehydrogenase family)